MRRPGSHCPGRGRSRPAPPRRRRRRAVRDAALLHQRAAGRQGHQRRDQGPAAHRAGLRRPLRALQGPDRRRPRRTPSCACSPAARPGAIALYVLLHRHGREEQRPARGRLPLAVAAARRDPDPRRRPALPHRPLRSPATRSAARPRIAESRAALARARGTASRSSSAARSRPADPWGDQLAPGRLTALRPVSAAGAGPPGCVRPSSRGVSRARARRRRARPRACTARPMCVARPSAGAGRRRPRRARRRRRGSGPRRAGPRARPASRA